MKQRTYYIFFQLSLYRVNVNGPLFNQKVFRVSEQLHIFLQQVI